MSAGVAVCVVRAHRVRKVGTQQTEQLLQGQSVARRKKPSIAIPGLLVYRPLLFVFRKLKLLVPPSPPRRSRHRDTDTLTLRGLDKVEESLNRSLADLPIYNVSCVRSGLFQNCSAFFFDRRRPACFCVRPRQEKAGWQGGR